MNSQVHKINRDLIFGWLIIVGVLFVTYTGEVLKGERTWQYMFEFLIVMALPALYCFYLYKKHPRWLNLQYYIVVGYFLMYIFVMLTGSTTLVFCYILPMLSLLVLYHNPKLILWTGVAALVVNVISIVARSLNGEINYSNSKDVEIQIALLVLCFLGAYMATGLYNSITEQNDSYVRMLDEKNNQIQTMTLQTIATIANTIDAKDEYTRGHSKRVSEYSAAIAQELGLSEGEVENIRSVALLHDIGKIGVPDSVLNKPGRLTQEEFQVMKQHTIIGEEILRDIQMLPGIDIGAKYHHERYDGSGYPEGLRGDEIPRLAQIIAVADAYDAMTSNRIYRRHLDDERVMREMEKGVGTQFEPKAAQALLTMLREGRLENISREHGEELNDVGRILTRVIEKNDEKSAEKLVKDELTGVYNCDCGEKLMREVSRRKKGCLMLFDLDRFRQINEQYGFIKGDIFLKISVQCIKKLREKMIIARFGGDEFAVWFHNINDEESAVRIVERFQKIVEEMILWESELEGMSFSIGVVIQDKENVSMSKMIQKADKALYMVKQQGGGGYHVHQENQEVTDKNQSQIDLEQLVAQIKQQDSEFDAIQQAYPELRRVFDVVSDIAQQKKQKVHLLLFTISYQDGDKMSVEEQERVMEYLERAVITSMEVDDFTTRYSGSQRIVVLSDKSKEQVDAVTSHIMKEFYKMYDRKEMSVSYQVADLSE